MSVERACELDAQAMQWLVRMDALRTAGAEADCEQWMSRSVRHRVAFKKAAVAWKRMEMLRRLRPHDSAAADPDLLKKKHNWLGWMWGSGTMKFAVGALIACIGALGAAAWLQQDDGVSYSTEVGEQKHLALLDGSTVDMNTNTEIRVQFSAEQREVVLVRGEALFNVAHDASRPFEVNAHEVTSRAVGTKFSVRLHSDERVETLVAEGRVLVLRKEEVFGIPLGAEPIGHTLSAGEQIVVDHDYTKVSRLGMTEATKRLRWTSGKVTFEGEGLGHVVDELNRYTRHPLMIRDPGIASTAVGGGFDTRNADAYARELVRFFGADKLARTQQRAAR
jgi:transmembrane sensor